MTSSPRDEVISCFPMVLVKATWEQKQSIPSHSQPWWYQTRPAWRQNSYIHPIVKRNHNLGNNRVQVENLDSYPHLAVMRWHTPFLCQNDDRESQLKRKIHIFVTEDPELHVTQKVQVSVEDYLFSYKITKISK